MIVENILALSLVILIRLATTGAQGVPAKLRHVRAARSF
jgi:hypothetical protein